MKLKLKYWFLAGVFVFIWIGAALYSEQFEKPFYAYAAWSSAGLCLIITFALAVDDSTQEK